MRNNTAKRTKLLGMSPSTAFNKLKKLMMFEMAKELKRTCCFRCGKEITKPEELSVEHKISWMNSDNPKDLFFDLKNISFSHLSCNISAASKPTKTVLGDPNLTHGNTGYRKGCRCQTCKAWKQNENKRNRKNL